MRETVTLRGESGVVREAFTLPLVFLTVALGGGLRVDAGGTLTFLAPPLMALVLALLLLAVLYRAGVLAPELLVAPDRAPLANASGFVVAAALAVASAQVFNTLTPEAGLLALAFNVAWLVLLGNTITTRPDRERALASLLVIFGAAFVVKYVVLGAVYAPEGGLTKRVVLAMLEGVSLGTLSYRTPGPVTGYVSFAAILLYLIGVALLPARRARDDGALIVTGELAEPLPRTPAVRDPDGR